MSVTVTIQPAEAEALDTYLDSGASGTNYGTATTLIWAGSGARQRHVLISFPFSKYISSGAKIIEFAQLSLYCEALGGTYAGRRGRLSLVLRDWVESEATWSSWRAGQAWTTAGGTGLDSDIYHFLDGTMWLYHAVETPGAGGWYDIRIPGSVIEKIIERSLFGFLFHDFDMGDRVVTFTSSSGATLANRPKISVSYEPRSRFYLLGGPARGF